MHQIFLIIGTVWAVVAIGLLFIAWRAAKHQAYALHGKIMTILTGAAWGFLALYLLRYRYPEAIPSIPPEYIPWLALHGTVALFPLFGATLLVFNRWRARRQPEQTYHFNQHHKTYGRVLILLWCFTHIGGIANAVLFY